MKKLLSFLTLTFILFAGCASPERTALNTIGTVGATADAAIGAYGTYIVTHPVPEAQVRAVREATKAYLAAVSASRLAVIAYKQGSIDKPALDRAVDALAAASAEVVRLIAIATGDIPSATLGPIPVPPRAERQTLNPNL